MPARTHPGICRTCGQARQLWARGLCRRCWDADRGYVGSLCSPLPPGAPPIPPAARCACGRPVAARGPYSGQCKRLCGCRRMGGRRMKLPPADPCRCPACAQAFRAPIVRSAHTLMGTRCLTPDELHARGWRRLAGRWMLPGPAAADRRVGAVNWVRLREDAA